VRLTKDEWLWALGSTPWDVPTQEKFEHELWQLAQEILRLGLSVVVDFGLWARIERDEMRSAARRLGVGVELHYLDLPADELWRRLDARNSQPPWDIYNQAYLDQAVALAAAVADLPYVHLIAMPTNLTPSDLIDGEHPTASGYVKMYAPLHAKLVELGF
jgi:predicted kinase